MTSKFIEDLNPLETNDFVRLFVWVLVRAHVGYLEGSEGHILLAHGYHGRRDIDAFNLVSCIAPGG